MIHVGEGRQVRGGVDQADSDDNGRVNGLAVASLRSRVYALAWATSVNALCAMLFWIVATIVGSPNFLSFWNRSPAGKIGLTLVVPEKGAQDETKIQDHQQ